MVLKRVELRDEIAEERVTLVAAYDDGGAEGKKLSPRLRGA
jgi:hypothetical protein